MNTTLFIVMGVLVGAVAIFLIVSTIIDRKKRKKLKIEKIEEEKEIKLSRVKVAIALEAIYDDNAKMLKNFVPSVGKLKMSDIKNKAKKHLKDLQNSTEFKYLKDGENTEDIQNIFNGLRTTNSNIWAKKMIEEMKIITKISKETSSDELKSYRKKFIAKLKERA